MPSDGDEKSWICSRGAVMNLHRVSSIVREISRDPCLNHSPIKGSKVLKPEKWESIFDSEGKVSGFRRALKLIILGGVDPSIRPEVWEFLLGCYSLSSTAAHRKQLRMARRERYEDLIRECQSMHSSIGTGTLAYVIGSKVMDARTLSNTQGIKKEISASGAENVSRIEKTAPETDNYSSHMEIPSDSAEPVNVEGNTDVCTCFSIKSSMELEESHFSTESYYDFPPLPVTDLFKKDDSSDLDGCKVHSCQSSRREPSGNDAMHSFQIDNNVDLIIESDNISSTTTSQTTHGEMETLDSRIKRKKGQTSQDIKNKIANGTRISDIPVAATATASISRGMNASEDRISEWLWTLHRIVVDVVRTDSHLEFYGDSRNMARMSDILAVYAWIDPATGYCQGMSDLLSPFIVLYEDNADAFWCFEILLRRLRENFQMEGPVGVMRQLKELWKILELTDAEIFAHLSLIGAESLHFAFRMLLVLFRRELSFSEALRMWEMMWAADFYEALARELEENCPAPLVFQLPNGSDAQICTKRTDNHNTNIKPLQAEHNSDEVFPSDHNGVRSDSRYPFCGLAKANFWPRHRQMEISNVSSSRSSDDDLPVFCVAAILITNRQKIMRKTHSIDDLIKMFNDNLLKINVKRCIHMAIRLRKKYYKILQTKHANTDASDQ